MRFSTQDMEKKGDGRIKFSDNGKPVIEQRSVLWEGIDGGSNRGEESTVISQINSRSANPHSADGYILYLYIAGQRTSKVSKPSLMD